MKMVKSLMLGSAAGLLAVAGAQAADLPVKAKAVEYVRICSLYGAGFWYIPGTDTCIRIGGSIRLDTAINSNIYDNPWWQGGASGSQDFNKDYYTTRTRFNLTEDTRTATEYGVLRTYANVQMDWTRGGSGIAGGAPVEVDYAFIQFAGFTMGKAVSEFDPQWALAKPTITSGFNAGSNDATGIPQLAYTWTFGGGLSATISAEDAQPYRTAGVINASQVFIAPWQASSLAAGTYGVASFTGNASAGDHIPDFVGNLRVDQAWGSAFISGAAHEVHGTYYNTVSGAPTVSDTGKPGSTYGYAVSGGFEVKNLPTGAGDSIKFEATYGYGAAKYVWGGTLDTAGAGRYARASGTSAGSSMAFGYVLDGVYTGINSSNGSNIALSTAWDVSAYFEHYWNPQWRTSLFGNYSSISYGSGSAAMISSLSGTAVAGGTATGSAANGFFTATAGTNGGSMTFATAQVGTRTAWQPVKDLTFSAEFLYSHMYNNLNGTWTAGSTNVVPGAQAGKVFTMGDQNIYQGAVQVLRSF